MILKSKSLRDIQRDLKFIGSAGPIHYFFSLIPDVDEDTIEKAIFLDNAMNVVLTETI
jgi:hypothetical protein